MKPSLALAAVLTLAASALAESRSVLVVVAHDTDGKAKVTIYSDDKQDSRDAVTVEEACKAVAGMKGWGSTVGVYLVTDRPLSRKDRKALFDAVDANDWLDLSYYGREAPKNLADHFLKPEETGDWQPVEVVAFTDFDDLEVKLSGKAHKAFLVGLRPLREGDKDRLEQLRKDVLAKLKKNALWARVVTTRGEAVGLSVDAFTHHPNDFGHGWDPNKYPECEVAVLVLR
ncbi:MAG TPA: hypothetical protein VKE74_02320 [Gemmataceae bacterium]|nr:hypothetical protein [Gemmataceae bacterium]